MMRATTTIVMAALGTCWGWMLRGPRQHEADLLSELGRVSPQSLSEAWGESR